MHKIQFSEVSKDDIEFKTEQTKYTDQKDEKLVFQKNR